MSNSIRLEPIGEAIIVRFTRPEFRNPLSIDVLDVLDEILSTYETIPTAKAIIFTGENGVFASGADLREIAAVDSVGAREFALRGQNLMTRIAVSKIITIAAVNGFCFGGALDLALACDKRIASPNAQFAHPGANLGIMTGWGGSQRLPRLIGEARALEMFMTASPVSAIEALRIGLIDQIADDPVAESLANVCAGDSS